MTKSRTLLAVSAAMLLILAAGCGSGQDIFGGGNNYPSNGPYNSSIHGTVDSVDTYGRSIVLTNTSGYNGMLSGSGGNGGTLRVYYDNNTSVMYNGQNYRPENLERGDQVDIQVAQNGNQLVAQSMTVTYNAAQSASYPSSQYPSQYPSSQYPSSQSNYATVRGTVQYVDTSARTITLTSTNWTTGYMPGYGSNNTTITVRYDPGLNLNVNGRTDSIAGLERGDVVDVQLRDLGNSNLLAQSVTLVRDVRR
jgi:hypothetical protein